jgi:hypothetical protein
MRDPEENHYNGEWSPIGLGALDTAATNRSTVPAPGDYDGGEIGGMIDWQGKLKYSEKN